MHKIIPIKAFNDNYIWTIIKGNEAVAVDPGDHQPLDDFLKKNNINLVKVFITHHHYDHSGGIEELLKVYDCNVYGPAGGHIKGITHPIKDGECIEVFQETFTAISTPGHTNDQLAYFSSNDKQPVLFCGDTLFAGGCGRLFEGTPSEMHQSLKKFSKMPKNTGVYCGHEYTESNLIFASEVEPNNEDIQNRLIEVREMRKENKCTLPSSIELELKTNPFMRCDRKEVIMAAKNYNKDTLGSPEEVLGCIRNWKDSF
jgi:hydroxyacylglutathione hydrolase|tara:strand:+ start:454 stop:1224 length:771 start_codon:yes stop_codon:yes gene_type:complete